MTALPTSSAESQDYSQQLCDLVQKKIVTSGGWISFSELMQMALYTPVLGYYSGGSQKFGTIKDGGGDFITAPQLTPLFAQALARQVAQVVSLTQGDVLELGAGTGLLAADLLLALELLGQLPNQYYILEVSSHLRFIQEETLKEKLSTALFERVVWLDTLPTNFVGIMLGNEVLDAIPVYLLVKKNDALFERGVTFNQSLTWRDNPLEDVALHNLIDADALPNDYVTEVCPAANGLIHSLATVLQTGAILMIDYGFSASEYYHPQRNEGTLMCHYHHYAHSNPLINLGLQDITAHVNFTAIAEAGLAQGLSLHGYCNQAQFLMSCGILDLLGAVSPDDAAVYMPMAAAVQKLLSPAEMGDLFKVISFTKNLAENDDLLLLGFVSGDKSHTL
ncbi:MAG: SAM-dependent methyltransferase [Methylophilaceae bacterium]|jgi:SAM-dependent MidA family methyltransferase|nr:SAM-dependent methyltransferase [Methylophilaceae bacterium]